MLSWCTKLCSKHQAVRQKPTPLALSPMVSSLVKPLGGRAHICSFEATYIQNIPVLATLLLTLSCCPQRKGAVCSRADKRTHIRMCRVPNAHMHRHSHEYLYAHAHIELAVPDPATHFQRKVNQQRWARGALCPWHPEAVRVDGLCQDMGTQQQGMHFRVSFICSRLILCSSSGRRGIGILCWQQGA